MADQQPFDPGLTQQYTGSLRRVINKDGSFNVRRVGVRLRDLHPYLTLISMSWTRFLGVTLAAYFLVNTAFAALYLLAGAEEIENAAAPSMGRTVWNVFLFSVHTFTTVGYGNMAPKGVAAGFITAVEAGSGWFFFAFVTGLLYARFSRPSVQLAFSREALIAPYQDGAALMFRVANRRPNVLMDLEARLLLMTVEPVNGRLQRRFTPLALERPRIHFLPLTWTVVHPIIASSPLAGLGPADLDRLQAEILVLIRSYDDSFSQTIHTRHSYTHDEVRWGARFRPAFQFDENGDMVLVLDQIDEVENVSLRTDSMSS